VSRHIGSSLHPLGEASEESWASAHEADMSRCILGETDAGSRGCSDSGDVGSEEVDAVSVEVAAGAVVVLGGA
jgi:hypothetical protein